VTRAALAAVLVIALAGCGSSTSSTGSAGRATLWVTRDRGAHVLYSTRVPAGESVLQALDRVAKVKTRFSGRYVRGVDGLEEHGNRSWFYYVNGYLADRSAADYRLRRGDVAWWDYRAWHNPAQDPVVVGAFPQPFLNGYDGTRRQTVIVSLDSHAVRAVARRLHAHVVGPGVGTLSTNVNVVYMQPGGGERAQVVPVGAPRAGGPVRFSFRGDPKTLLRPRPFRYRYEVGG